MFISCHGVSRVACALAFGVCGSLASSVGFASPDRTPSTRKRTAVANGKKGAGKSPGPFNASNACARAGIRQSRDARLAASISAALRNVMTATLRARDWGMVTDIRPSFSRIDM